ncbi:MAG: helix-turn-helix domain-containing protein [Solirubrobacteraceae bacterium]
MVEHDAVAEHADIAEHADVALAGALAHEVVVLRRLRRYLELAGNPGATAQKLHLHRSTLYQRLKKIETVAGVDLRSGVAQGRRRFPRRRPSCVAALSSPFRRQAGRSRGCAVSTTAARIGLGTVFQDWQVMCRITMVMRGRHAVLIEAHMLEVRSRRGGRRRLRCAGRHQGAQGRHRRQAQGRVRSSRCRPDTYCFATRAGSAMRFSVKLRSFVERLARS